MLKIRRTKEGKKTNLSIKYDLNYTDLLKLLITEKDNPRVNKLWEGELVSNLITDYVIRQSLFKRGHPEYWNYDPIDTLTEAITKLEEA